jgi:hypothetical protein
VSSSSPPPERLSQQILPAGAKIALPKIVATKGERVMVTRRVFRFVLPVGLLALLAFLVPAGAHHGSADLAMSMSHVANSPTPPEFEAGPEASDFNSDLAFWGNIAAVGNYTASG